MQEHRTVAASRLLKWFGWTDRGRVRPNNEDAFLGLQFDAREIHHLGKIGEASMEHMDFVFAVCDGMGGARAGEHASRIAVDKITTLLPRSYRQSAIGMDPGYEEVLDELFDQVHRALTYLGASYKEYSGMETTLSLCWFTPHWMHFAHIGDTRIYYVPAHGDHLKQLTEDDTHVGWLFRNKKINEREARSHPRRKILQKALGGGNQFVDPQVGAVAYEKGDIFLLCTDGLVEGLHDNHLAEHLRDPQFRVHDANLAHRLVEQAIEKDGGDNTTALVIQIT
jgi:protein phosphatase